MRELSLHILDIIQNSISAEANLIKLIIKQNTDQNLFDIKITDDGKGIEKDKLKKVIDPFETSRKTRDVGLGLPLLAETARRCQGDLNIKSTPGKGTQLRVYFVDDHIDRPPLGDIEGTIISLIALNPDIDFVFRFEKDGEKFDFKTEEIKKELEGIKINNSRVLNWIKEFLEKGLAELNGGDLGL